MSFRRRLSLLCTGALALSLASAIVLAYVTEHNSLSAQLDALLRARAEQVTPDVVQEVLAANDLLPKQRKTPGAERSGTAKSGLTGPASASPRAAAVGVGLSDLVLVTAEGQLAPTSTSFSGPQALHGPARAVAAGRSPPVFTTFSLSHSRFRAYVFRAAPGVAGELAVPLAQLDSSLRDLRTRFGFIALGAVLLVSVLAGLVARQAMRPIAALTAAAEGVVRTGELRARVPTRTDARDEIARLAITINRMLAALERSVSSQRQLVADASHELRTPLTTLTANLQLLDEPGGLAADDAAQLVAHARTEAEALASLVSDLVELAREGQVELHLTDVRLDLVAAAAAERVGRRAENVVFHTDLSPCTVRGDADLLDRAVGNLLENAVKWSPAGGTIELIVRDGEITVADQGPGIEEADLPFVFDRFYRAATARSQPGSGLGLAIVRQIVQLHGGRADAGTSERGASMRIVLPTIPDDPAY